LQERQGEVEVRGLDHFAIYPPKTISSYKMGSAVRCPVDRSNSATSVRLHLRADYSHYIPPSNSDSPQPTKLKTKLLDACETFCHGSITRLVMVLRSPLHVAGYAPLRWLFWLLGRGAGWYSSCGSSLKANRYR
jgi:hypothetical protein